MDKTVEIENEIKPDGPKGTMCPKWRRDCSKVCKTCMWWIRVTTTSEDGQSKVVGYQCSQNVTAAGVWRVAHEQRVQIKGQDKIANGITLMREVIGSENLKISELLKPIFRMLGGGAGAQIALEHKRQDLLQKPDA